MGESAAWDSLGEAYRLAGAHEQSIACYERAIQLFAELPAPQLQADALTQLGDLRHELGDTEAAVRGAVYRMTARLERRVNEGGGRART